MRTISLNLREALLSQETEEVVVVLVKISHPDLATPLRFSSDTTQRITTDPLVYGTVSGGQNFLFLPMKVQLPDEDEDKPPMMRLVLDNVNRQMIALMRSTTTPAVVDVDIVLASTPNTIEVSLPSFDVVAISYDATSMTIEMNIDALNFEPFPAGSFTPAGFGGLF